MFSLQSRNAAHIYRYALWCLVYFRYLPTFYVNLLKNHSSYLVLKPSLSKSSRKSFNCESFSRVAFFYLLLLLSTHYYFYFHGLYRCILLIYRANFNLMSQVHCCLVRLYLFSARKKACTRFRFYVAKSYPKFYNIPLSCRIKDYTSDMQRNYLPHPVVSLWFALLDGCVMFLLLYDFVVGVPSVVILLAFSRWCDPYISRNVIGLRFFF